MTTRIVVSVLWALGVGIVASGCSGGSSGGGGFVPPPPPPSTPVIALSPSSFTFSAVQGGPNPPTQSLTVNNSGAGTLSWSATDDAAWLSLSPTSGTNGGAVVLSVDISALAPGSYSAVVTVTASGASNSPQTAAVSLTVSPSPATQVALTSGNNQVGTAGSTLGSPFVVTVRDGSSNPVSGFTVSWSVSSGGGNLSASSTTTNAQGQAQTYLTLGTTAGGNTVTATASGLSGSPVTFTATGVAGPATQIALTSGNNQAGPSGTALGAPFVVTVRDANNNAVQGTSVNWSVTGGGGSVSAGATTTNASGQAQTTLTLGSVGAINSATASSAGLSGSPVAFTAIGQGLTYARRAGGTSDDGAQGVTAVPGGGFIVTGQFQGTATFGPGEASQTMLTSAGGYDVFVARYNADGTLAWAKRAGSTSDDSGARVGVFSDGSSVVAGYFQGSATFGPGEAGQTVLASAGGLELFVARFNADGTLAWAKRAGGTGSDVGAGVAVRSDGTCVVTGYFTGSATFGPGEAGQTVLTSAGGFDMCLASYNANGTLAWAKRAGGTSDDIGLDVATFPDGSCAATGRFMTSATFGPGEAGQTVLTIASGQGVFVARFNADGTLAWARQGTPNATQPSVGNGIAVLSDGSVVATGQFQIGITFGATNLSSTSYACWVARYLGDGTLSWAKQAGSASGCIGRAVTQLTNGVIVVVGQFQGTSTWGPGEAGQVVITSAGNFDAFLAGYQVSDGSLRWAKNAGGANPENGLGACPQPDGSLITTGSYSGSATFGPGESGQAVLTSSSTVVGDVFVAKYFPY